MNMMQDNSNEKNNKEFFKFKENVLKKIELLVSLIRDLKIKLKNCR